VREGRSLPRRGGASAGSANQRSGWLAGGQSRRGVEGEGMLDLRSRGEGLTGDSLRQLSAEDADLGVVGVRVLEAGHMAGYFQWPPG